jgi:YD repeat-containing protein
LSARHVGGDTQGSREYDALGRLTQAQDDDSTVQFTYDSLSRVLTEVQGANPLGQTGKTVDYTANAEGEVTKITYPSSFDPPTRFEARRTLDDLGRLTALADQNDTTIASFALYGPAGRTKKTTFGNSTTANFAYDGYRRPTEIAHKTSTPTEFAGFTYGWDDNDNPLYEARSHKSGKGDVYTYDKANRLTKTLRDVDDPAAEVADPGSEAYVTKLEYDMDDVFRST